MKRKTYNHQLQLHEKDKHKEIVSIGDSNKQANILRQFSKDKVLHGDLQKKLSSSLSVRTNSKVELPKLQYAWSKNKSTPVWRRY